MDRALNASLKPLDALLLLAVLSALLVGATLDWSFFHPGYAAYDEESLLAQVQAVREGLGFHWGLGDGSLYRALASGLALVFGPALASVHAAALLLIVAETLLFVAWGLRLGQPRAGVWAALMNAASAHTWVRARSMLAFTAFPAQLLLALWVLPKRGSGPVRAAVTGAGLSLLALDYELWLLGLPLLTLAWVLWQRPHKSELAAALGTGLACLGLFALLSGMDLGSYWQVRSAHTFASLDRWQAWAQGLAALVVPQDEVLPFLGATGIAWAPFWMLALVAVGLFKSPPGYRWLLAFLLAALAPVALGNTAIEPQRLLLAWPLFCAAAALAAARWAGAEGWKPALLSVCLAAMAVPAWSAFQRSQQRGAIKTYGLAANRLEAVREISRLSRQRPLHMLSDLDQTQGLVLRLHLEAAGFKEDASGQLVVPAAWDHFPQGWDPSWGAWLVVAQVPEVPEQPWLFPAPDRVKSLSADAALLGAYWPKAVAAVGARQSRDAAAAALAQGPSPWARSILAMRWLSACKDLAELPEKTFASLLAGPLMGGAFHHESAEFLRGTQPLRALGLVEEACRRDPRRLEALQLRSALRRELGRPDPR